MNKLKPQVTIVYEDEANPERKIVLHRAQNGVFGGKITKEADIQLMHDALEAVIADLEFHRAEYAAYIETIQQPNENKDN